MHSFTWMMCTFALSQFKCRFIRVFKKHRLTDIDLELSNVDLVMLITKNLGFKKIMKRQVNESCWYSFRKLGRYALDQLYLCLVSLEA